MFTRVAVVNRGEAAVRLIRAVRQLNEERGHQIKVNSRTAGDSRVADVEAQLAEADEGDQAQLRLELAELRTVVRSEKLGDVAEEFERVHNIERARTVGSVHAIISARELRPYLIGAVERGISRASTDPQSAVVT